MVGYNGNKWHQAQLDYMAERADQYLSQGKRPPWDAIATEVGHPKASCQQMMSRIRAKRAHEQKRLQLIEIRRAAAQQVKPTPGKKPKPLRLSLIDPAIPGIDCARPTSTAKLRMDAELRERIGVLGITAGLLGDPLPGRSALDRKREGLRR